MPGIVSITAPPASSALTTLWNAKLQLGLSDTGQDDYVTMLIAHASNIVSNYIGRVIGKQTVTETFRSNAAALYPYGDVYHRSRSANDVKPFVLTYPVVTAVNTVVSDGTTLTPNTDYEVEGDSGLLWRLSAGMRIGWTGAVTTVSYDAGWVLPQDAGSQTLPPEIEAATLAVLRALYHSQSVDPAMTSEQVEGVGRIMYDRSKTVSTGLDAAVQATLAPYRSVVW